MKITRTFPEGCGRPILAVTHPLGVSPFRGVPQEPDREVTFDTDDPLVVLTNGLDDILTITVGGEVIPGPGIHMDDAARAFLEALGRLGNFPFGLPSHR